MASNIKNAANDKCAVKTFIGTSEEYTFKVEGNFILPTLCKRLRLMGDSLIKVTYAVQKYSDGQTTVRNSSAKTGKEVLADITSQMSDDEKLACADKPAKKVKEDTAPAAA